MRYIISDIHGCKKQYLELLEKIKFSDKDHLYILGDSVDRGEQPIEVLRYIMGQKNVTYILGNHDYNFYAFIKELGLNLDHYENDEINIDSHNTVKVCDCDEVVIAEALMEANGIVVNGLFADNHFPIVK